MSQTISYPKSRVVSISIFLSLVLHSALLYIQVRLMREQSAVSLASAAPEKFAKPLFMIAPPKQKEKLATSSVSVSEIAQKHHVQPALMPTQTSAPFIPISAPAPTPPAGRRIHRVGTGFDAPDTEQALALGEKTPDGRGGTPHAQKVIAHNQQPVTVPIMDMPPVPSGAHEPEFAEHGRESQQGAAPTFDDAPSMTGRVPVYGAGAGERKPAESAPNSAVASALSFLSNQRFTDMMRQNILANQDDTSDGAQSFENQRVGGIGMPGRSGGVAQQYGDPKYLHYNSKVYTAIQQSMEVAMAQLSHRQYAAIIDGTKRAARVRFALDNTGAPQAIRIAVSSGNESYDTLVQRIIAEASFPSIPQSFNMHATYHNYGIILYADGTSREHIGVSPYIDGE